MLPNLFVVGAAKSGTTSLQRYLAQHPDVFMCPVQEPNYFAFAGGLPDFAGPDLPGADARLRRRLLQERYAFSIVDASAYQRLFRRARRRPVCGDCSPAYLAAPAAATRIRGLVPEARIVAILRNPVDRAYAKFLQMRRDRAEPLTSFAEALAAEPGRERQGWAPTWLYARRGFYHRQLEPFFRHFGADRVRVILYDDLERDPASCMRTLFEFLGLDPKVELDLSRRHNSSTELDLPRQEWLYERLAHPLLQSPALLSTLPAGLAAWARPLARRALLRQQPLPPPEPLTMELHLMLAARYVEDIGRLGKLIGRSLEHWLAPSLSVRRASQPEPAPVLRLAA